jgi:hypothetical protein
MSTRACYIFRDEDDTCTVYVHHDGYPEGAAEKFVKALPLAWPLPRYEALDFAAAFIAGNKTGGGSVYLSKGAEHHGDLEYVYEVFPAENGQLIISAWNDADWQTKHKNPAAKKAQPFFYGRLKDFCLQHKADWPASPSID